MRRPLSTLTLATICAVAVNANPIPPDVTIVLVDPNQIAVAGQTLQFFGTITNNTDTFEYLNGDSFTLPGNPTLTVVDDFASNVPIFLAPNGSPGDSSGDIELFDVTVSNPLQNPAGTYEGAYTLIGGDDGGTDSAQDVLGSTSFSITTTPEPSTIYPLLVLSAILVLVVANRSRLRKGLR